MTPQPPAPQLALIALSPCPFCGSDPTMDAPLSMRPLVSISCGECVGELSVTTEYMDRDAAITAWNTRPQSRPEAELPEFPEADGFIKRPSAENSHNRSEPYYFASKLRAYGQQCAATRTAGVGGDGWLPIESAPRNARILITGGTWSASDREESPFMSVTIAYWCVDHWRGDDLQSHDEWMRHKPTHWQLLPARSAPGSEVKP